MFHDTCIENIRIIQVESYNCWQQMLLHRCLYLNWINYSLCVIGDERQLILIKFWWTNTVWLIISSTAVLLNSTDFSVTVSYQCMLKRNLKLIPTFYTPLHNIENNSHNILYYYHYSMLTSSSDVCLFIWLKQWHFPII